MPEPRIAQPADVIKRLNRHEVRAYVAARTALVGIVATLCAWWYLLPSGAPDTAVFFWIPVILAVWLLAFLVAQSLPRLASIIVVLAGFLSAIVAAGAFGLRDAAYILVIPVTLAAVLSGPWSAVGAALVGAAIAARLLPAGAWHLPVLIILGAGAIQWVAMRPLHFLLDWSWQRSAEATHLAEALRDHQGELNRALTALDLTNRLLQRTNHELAAARHEAEDARRLKEDFAVNISHELRTPLNIILGFTEIMHQSPEVYGEVRWPPTLRRDLTEIYRSARYLSDMVDDILDLARMEAALLPVRRELTDLGQVIQEAAGIAAALLRDRPVRLVVDLPPGLPSLPLDRTRIRQVLLNLITNASRYTERGTITVSAGMGKGEISVSVADTGVGIPQTHLEAIFDEFRQVDAWRQGESQGKGLGLAIAKRFVQLHGGRIWAESRIDEGSTFSFTLPLERKEFSRLRAGEPAPLPDSPFPRTVVVVDSDEVSTWHLRRRLDGYRVVHATDVGQVPALCADLHPEALVINTLRPEPLPAGAWPTDVTRIECALPTASSLTEGGYFRAVLHKPVSQAELLAAVRGVLPAGDVLVVDDDRGFVQLVVRMLAATGDDYRPRWAYSAAEALGKLRRERPGLVLVDLMMPEMSGVALARAIAEDPELGEVPVIGVTGAAFLLATRATAGERFVLERPGGLREKALIELIRLSLEVAPAEYAKAPGSAPALPETPVATPAS